MRTTILAFDLSSVCIGVIAATINDGQLEHVKSCPIIPPKFNPETIGYQKTKKKLADKNGVFFNTYYRSGEHSISKTEKIKRDREVRLAANNYVMDYIGGQISKIADVIEPDLIIAEKNEIFNGILTSILLSKIFGILLGVSSSHRIPCDDFKVTVVRSIIPVVKVTREYANSVSEDELKRIPDITKRALRILMEKTYGRYGLSCSTDDESDACVVFHYWYEEIYKKGGFRK